METFIIMAIIIWLAVASPIVALEREINKRTKTK